MSSRKTNTARAQENLEAVAEAQKKTIEAAVKNGTEAFAKGYERLYGASREQFEQANQAAFQGYGQFAEFNRENFEAVVHSGNIVAKGVEVMSKEFSSYAQKSAETNLAVAKKMSAVRNIQDALDLQAGWAKDAFDSFWAESAKLQDLTVKVSNEATAPISERVNAAVETFTKPVTA